MAKTRIGIDLGTTNTVSAAAGAVFELTQGSRRSPFLPSVVAYPPSGATLVGAAARRRRVIDAKNTIYSAKRLIGRRFRSWDAQTFRELYPFDVVETEEGEAAFRTRRGVITPAEVGASVLRALLERGVGAVPDSAVITVPSVFKERQREATLGAARLAGLEEVLIIDEPIATVWAYREGEAELGLVTVYDLGGGTFDVAVVDSRPEACRVLGHKGDLYLGGDDIDHTLARWAAEQLLTRSGWDAQSEPEVFDRLVAECEAAKVRLCSQAETTLDLARVDPIAPDDEGGVLITRAMLDTLTTDLVRRTFTLCDQLLGEVGVTVEEIDTVLLAGGTTQLPTIREGVEAYFRREPRCDLHPMQVVSLGASAAPEGLG